jgi:hypothetical protein
MKGIGNTLGFYVKILEVAKEGRYTFYITSTFIYMF